MADGSSVNSAPATPNAPATADNSPNSAPAPSGAVDNADLLARGDFSDPLGEKKAPSKAKEPTAESDDDEFEVAGEKVKRSEFKKLRELEKRRKEFDAAAHKRMQDAAESRKTIEAREAEFLRVANALEADPWAIHKHRGLTDAQLDAMAEQRLIAQMQRAQMTPEQIELQQIKAERDALKAEKETGDKTVKEQKAAELKTKYVKHFDLQIGEAMKAANLARTRSTAAKVAGVMADFIKSGTPIDPMLAAQLVRDGYQTEMRHELGELVKTSPRDAIALLGPELIAEIVKQQSTAAKTFVPQNQPPKPRAPTPQPKPKDPPTFEQVRKELGIRGF